MPLFIFRPSCNFLWQPISSSSSSSSSTSSSVIIIHISTTSRNISYQSEQQSQRTVPPAKQHRLLVGIWVPSSAFRIPEPNERRKRPGAATQATLTINNPTKFRSIPALFLSCIITTTKRKFQQSLLCSCVCTQIYIYI